MKRVLVYSVMALVAAELLLVLVSWLLSATVTGDVRSLLSSEGIRWFFGSFTAMLASPGLVWLLLLSMAGGCLWQSGLFRKVLGYRDRVALRTAFALLVVFLCVVAALTVVPHAVLLSSTGRLYPSPFSRACVPVLSFGTVLCAVAYGWVSGRFPTVYAVIGSLSYGIGKAAPAFVLYVLVVQFIESLRFVFF